MDRYLLTMSNGDTVLVSEVPGVMQASLLAEDGLQEVSRDKLPDMTHKEFEALMRQSATHHLTFDKGNRRVVATPKKTHRTPGA